MGGKKTRRAGQAGGYGNNSAGTSPAPDSIVEPTPDTQAETAIETAASDGNAEDAEAE